MNPRLTSAQRYMVERLAEIEPLDDWEMLVTFGRSWARVWAALEERGLVYYAPYARRSRHYRTAKPEPENKSAIPGFP